MKIDNDLKNVNINKNNDFKKIYDGCRYCMKLVDVYVIKQKNYLSINQFYHLIHLSIVVRVNWFWKGH